MPYVKLGLEIGLVLISIGTIITWLGFSDGASYDVFDHNSPMYAENGLIENSQASLLAIACMVYLATAVFSKNPKKLILFSCSLLCYSMALRELDVEKLKVASALKIVGSGIGQNTTIAAAFTAIFTYAAVTNYSTYKNAALEFIRTLPGVLLMAGGLFLLIGVFLENQKTMTHHVVWEETCELVAYVLILCSSLSAIYFRSSLTICSSGRSKARREN